MDNLDIIKELESILPVAYKNASIISDNTPVPFYTFLENNFIKFVKPGATAEVLAEYIKTQLTKLITFENPALIAVNNFIENNPMFRDVIQTGKDSYISVSSYLKEFSLKNMAPDGTIKYGIKSVSLTELYLTILNNEYHEPTLEEKAELALDMTRYIDEPILDSIVDGMEITVRDYITKVIPPKMNGIDTVLLDGETIPLTSLVTEIVNHQAKMLDKEKEQMRLSKEDEYNKTGDNPGLVSEIQVKINENNALEITAEIPVVASSLLTEEEKNSLLSNYASKKAETNEEYFTRELNKIKLAIDKTNNAHDLDTKETFFKNIAKEAIKKVDSPKITALISSIEDLIIIKRNSIIKITNNQEEYTDVLFSEINSMKEELSLCTTLDDYSVLYGKAIERYADVYNKKITDVQLKSSFHSLFDNIAEKRLNLDSTIGYQSPEVERAKIDLNTLISDIKQDVLTIEHDSNNLGNLTGTEIRLNSNIQTAKEKVNAAYANKLLTEDDREYYMNRLKGYSMAIKSETKIGYGLR